MLTYSTALGITLSAAACVFEPFRILMMVFLSVYLPVEPFVPLVPNVRIFYEFGFL